MRVLVARAAGAIGSHLVPMLIADGHPVSGTSRDFARAEWLRSVGAEPVVVDVYDADAGRRATKASRPEAVIHQLTDLAERSVTLVMRIGSTLLIRNGSMMVFQRSTRRLYY